MKISVKSNFKLDETDVETGSATLGDFLNELSRKYKKKGFDEFFDEERHEVYPDCQVFLNGKSYDRLRDRLNTKLKDGDKVEIQLMMLAGG